MARSQTQRIIITLGDPDGIGPEIVAKLIHSRTLKNSASLEWILVGSEKALLKANPSLKIAKVSIDQIKKHRPSNRIALIPAPVSAPSKKLCLQGYQAGWSIETATKLVISKWADAIVTGPIDKSRLIAGGYSFPGHTEFLAHLCKKKDVTMMLANEQFRVSLVTTHVALSAVPKLISARLIEKTLLHTYEGLKSFFRISKPKIAVLALNPHCGEKGVFGREEIDVISPTIASVSQRYRRNFTVSGPHSADTFFATEARKPQKARHHAIVCMYHDQGLIPVKLADFGRTVNITLGLPIIRTSVDHGVGFDIAGRGLADPSSFAAAAKLAEALVRKKK